MRNLKLLIATFVLETFAFSMCLLSQTEDALNNWRKPTVTEMTNLFRIAVRSIPSKMVFEAEVVVQEPTLKATNEDFDETVDSMLDLKTRIAEATNETPPTREEVAQELRDFAANYKGEKLRVREWFSGPHLYRKDETNFENLGSDVNQHQQDVESGRITPEIMREIIAADKARIQAFRSGKLVYDDTYVEIGNPDFLKGTKHPDVKFFHVSRDVHPKAGFVNASINNSTVAGKQYLWKAWVLDPELAFPLVFYFAKRNVEAAQKMMSQPASVNSFKTLDLFSPDVSRIKQFLETDQSDLLILTRDENLSGKLTTRIVLKHKKSKIREALALLKNVSNENNPMAMALSEFMPCEYSFWLDKHDPPRLLRAEKLVPGKFLLLYEMNSFDENHFPGFWRKEEKDLTRDQTWITEAKFLEVDLNPDFKDEDAFGLGLWGDIQKITKRNHETGEMLYNPDNVKFVNQPNSWVFQTQGRLRTWIYRVILLGFVVGAAFLVWRALQRRKENERNKNPYRIR